jgi:ABC-2 type transport system ATP-binding protein
MDCNAPPVMLRATDLTRRYGDIVAVDHLSLEVRRGEILGFLGPNGAGKTTTLKMLCGLLRPDAGRIEIDGATVSPGAPRARHAIGVSPQATAIWEMLTPFEQLSFTARMYDLAPRDARRRADELIAAFGLEDKRNRLARTLSGGMQRRLNIALALVHGPEFVFLDEPQAGLDPQSRVLVRDYIRRLAGRATFVVTTHDMDEAEKLSDRVCIIDHGRVLACDTVERIKSQIGEGDLFEIEVGPGLHAALGPLVDRLRRESRYVATQGTLLQFTCEDGGETLSEVLQIARGAGLKIDRIGTRRKTLEDVFIRLTGRGLRE